MKNDRRMRILSMRRGGPFGETGGQHTLFDAAKSHKIAFMTALLHLDDEIVVGIASTHAHFLTDTFLE